MERSRMSIDHNDAESLGLIATVFGFNELAKQSKTLGEKVFFRMLCQKFHKDLESKGVKISILEDNIVLTVHFGNVGFTFYEKDIELMRQTVAEWDKNHEKESSSETS
jgi:hypothetical protein